MVGDDMEEFSILRNHSLKDDLTSPPNTFQNDKEKSTQMSAYDETATPPPLFAFVILGL